MTDKYLVDALIFGFGVAKEVGDLDISIFVICRVLRDIGECLHWEPQPCRSSFVFADLN